MFSFEVDAAAQAPSFEFESIVPEVPTALKFDISAKLPLVDTVRVHRSVRWLIPTLHDQR